MALHEELSSMTVCAVEVDGGWELWEGGARIGGTDSARDWAWRVSPGRLAVLHGADGCAVVFDRAECVGADWPDVVERIAGQRMERPVV